MAWHTQQDDPRPERPPESPYAIAWAALLLSLLACAMSGYVLLKNVDLRGMGGKFKENLKLIESETEKVLNKHPDAEDAEKGDAAALKHGDAPPGGEQDAVKWDRLQERVGDIEKMAKDGDARAGTYIESLKRDLATLRDYTTEKGSASLDRLMSGLQDAREKLSDSSADAAERLRQLRHDLEPQVRSALDRAKSLTGRSAPADAKPAEPPAPPGTDEGPAK